MQDEKKLVESKEPDKDSVTEQEELENEVVPKQEQDEETELAPGQEQGYEQDKKATSGHEQDKGVAHGQEQQSEEVAPEEMGQEQEKKAASEQEQEKEHEQGVTAALEQKQEQEKDKEIAQMQVKEQGKTECHEQNQDKEVTQGQKLGKEIAPEEEHELGKKAASELIIQEQGKEAAEEHEQEQDKEVAPEQVLEKDKEVAQEHKTDNEAGIELRKKLDKEVAPKQERDKNKEVAQKEQGYEQEKDNYSASKQEKEQGTKVADKQEQDNTVAPEQERDQEIAPEIQQGKDVAPVEKGQDQDKKAASKQEQDLDIAPQQEEEYDQEKKVSSEQEQDLDIAPQQEKEYDQEKKAASKQEQDLDIAPQQEEEYDQEKKAASEQEQDLDIAPQQEEEYDQEKKVSSEQEQDLDVAPQQEKEYDQEKKAASEQEQDLDIAPQQETEYDQEKKVSSEQKQDTKLAHEQEQDKDVAPEHEYSQEIVLEEQVHETGKKAPSEREQDEEVSQGHEQKQDKEVSQKHEREKGNVVAPEQETIQDKEVAEEYKQDKEVAIEQEQQGKEVAEEHEQDKEVAPEQETIQDKEVAEEHEQDKEVAIEQEQQGKEVAEEHEQDKEVAPEQETIQDKEVAEEHEQDKEVAIEQEQQGKEVAEEHEQDKEAAPEQETIQDKEVVEEHKQDKEVAPEQKTLQDKEVVEEHEQDKEVAPEQKTIQDKEVAEEHEQDKEVALEEKGNKQGNVQDKQEASDQEQDQAKEVAPELEQEQTQGKWRHREQSKQQVYQEQEKELAGKQKDEQEQHQEQSVDEFSSVIKRKTNDLIYLIKTQFGLLDALVSNHVLTEKQVSLIREKDTDMGQVKQLLEELMREAIPDGKKEAFLTALDTTHQKHVSNLIRGNGHRATEYGDHWPFMYCTEYKKMTTRRHNLIELIDSKNGLLDKMFSAGGISNQHRYSVEKQITDEKKNKKLYHIVLWGSHATYKTFIRCLLETKQHQVVFLLSPSLMGDTRPLSDCQQHRLKKNVPTLIRILNSKDGLTAELFADDCITSLQKSYIDSATGQSESTKRLIDIVRRGSETNFHKFIKCLNKTGQNHVSRTLTEDGTVAHIIVNISSVINLEQERQIVDQLQELLRKTPDEHNREDLFSELVNKAMSEAQQRINQLHENEVTILTAEIEQCGIGLFYFTTSLRGLQYLYEIYSNEQLKSMMQEIFIKLLKADDAVVDLSVDILRWDQSNCTDCLQKLCTFNNLPILSHVYEMAKENKQLVAMGDDVRSLPIDQLPFELIKTILVRATGHLFVTINRRTPRAEVYALATMTAVSHLWWVTLSYRKYIKRSLKRSFKRVCHPFKCSPQQVTNLYIEGGNDVVGVAVLKNELFVACGGSNTIQVFDSRPPFRRQEDIQVQGLDRVSDITVCNKSSSLFIADQGTECAIWRVNLLATEQTYKFIAMQLEPLSLSVNNSRLLITPHDGDSLYLYGDDGNELHHIGLPRCMNASHAVETTDKTYLVSHYNRFIGDTLNPHNVTEVDANGRVVRIFSDDLDLIHLNYPFYMVLDNNHVIIADRYNDRIILLESNLQLKRILIKSSHGKRPYRLCLTSSRLLTISYWGSTDIDIYQV